MIACLPEPQSKMSFRFLAHHKTSSLFYRECRALCTTLDCVEIPAHLGRYFQPCCGEGIRSKAVAGRANPLLPTTLDMRHKSQLYSLCLAEIRSEHLLVVCVPRLDYARKF